MNILGARISGVARLSFFLANKVKIMVNGWRIKEQIFTSLAILLVLSINGAIPFLMVPDTGITAWAMGFSQSMANGEFFDFYSHDFGIPKPAAIAFGLAGAWPASLLIRAGLDPWDAYTGMSAVWLLLAMFSAYRIGLRFNGKKSMALFGAVAWMTMPIIWSHTNYAMLSLGIALLSFYFLAAFGLFIIGSKEAKLAPSTIILYFSATLISVFMDGYTFMMFATGSSILLFYSVITRHDNRPKLLLVSLPTHVFSFATSYLLYILYIGRANFVAEPLDIFRAWGLDLSFLAIPTKGVFWLSDLLGISVERSDQLYFGDASVWISTFALPILILGVFAWLRVRHWIQISTGIFLLSIFGFYMALGPSLKIHSVKPADLQLSQTKAMASEYAIAPTGNGWLSETLPGFDVMRASYRWSALGIFALWLLVIIFISTLDRKTARIGLIFLLVVVLFNVPNFEKKLKEKINNRGMFLQIDRDLVSELDQRINPNETVLFLPWKNDFMANYTAPRVGFRTFNIGGDKNLAIANPYWPQAIIAFKEVIDSAKVKSSLSLLIDGSADVIVLPYFDMLWATHDWPCEKVGSTPDFLCPPDRRIQLKPVIADLLLLPFVSVVETDLFATIRLSSKYSNQADNRILIENLTGKIRYPVEMNSESSQIAKWVLEMGWHALEPNHVWSKSEANLRFLLPEDCKNKKCVIAMSFRVFGASPKRSVEVQFNSAEKGWAWSQKIRATSNEVFHLAIPIKTAKVSQRIGIKVPTATSPMLLGISPDNRVLGISLIRLDLIKP